jgi:hypothetical protein
MRAMMRSGEAGPFDFLETDLSYLIFSIYALVLTCNSN